VFWRDAFFFNKNAGFLPMMKGVPARYEFLSFETGSFRIGWHHPR
jgi:hypothetical protein